MLFFLKILLARLEKQSHYRPEFKCCESQLIACNYFEALSAKGIPILWFGRVFMYFNLKQICINLLRSGFGVSNGIVAEFNLIKD